ncbi:hypothetical protein SEA_JONJAMES_172 [Gordonia Phage JonJames]|nr:hypothetical protein SEA_JONJAMES_172 [Gordonia Phage JonJames]
MTTVSATLTTDEARESIAANLAELRQKAHRAFEVGDMNQYAILHGLINDDLDAIDMLNAGDDVETVLEMWRD